MITTTAPYSAAENVVKVLERYRSTTFGGGPISSALVQKLGMGDEVARRVVLSLKDLELIDDDGMPTEALEAFEKAATDQYRAVLATHLRGVYAPVFNVLGPDISTASPVEIEDQFRDFVPKTLRGRMARCFVGLCAYAGITETATSAKSGPKPPRPAVNQVSRSPRSVREERRPAKVSQMTTESVTALLSSGGTLTIALTGRVSDLEVEERSKIFALFDEVKSFGLPKALPAGSRMMDVVLGETESANKFK